MVPMTAVDKVTATANASDAANGRKADPESAVAPPSGPLRTTFATIENKGMANTTPTAPPASTRNREGRRLVAATATASATGDSALVDQASRGGEVAETVEVLGGSLD